MHTDQAESPFGFDEIFYSKTDPRGIIQSGNDVFRRVSEFTWEELINKPHNVIRHPDMPRGVFHLLWEYLKANKPIGAFVKNRSKSGKYYWVFALAMPTDDGYLSVRIKPTGDLLETVQNEYVNLRKREHQEKLTPEDSHKQLIERLKQLGFADYTAFMTTALTNQIEQRCKALQVPVGKAVHSINDIDAVSTETINQTKKILQAYQKSKFIPLNLEVHAARLGEEGKQLSVVANQYQGMAEEINAEMQQFETMSRLVSERTQEGKFYVGACQLMNDVTKMIAHSDRSNGENKDTQDLLNLSKRYLSLSQTGLKEIQNVFLRFKKICEGLQILGSGLELVRITGKIETARLEGAQNVSAMLGELQSFQTALSSGLRLILDGNTKMDLSSVVLMRELSSMARGEA